MRNNPVDLGSVKIPVSASNSDALVKGMQYMRGITIFAPPTLTGTVTVQVSGDKGVTFKTLYSGGVAIDLPASSAIAIDYVGWDALRVSSSGIEAAERVFVIKGVEEVR